MQTDRQKLGKIGEKIAKNFLQMKGYTIITTNFRGNRGEIDIICSKSDDLIIIEVKSVRSIGFGSGEERISKKKQLKLIHTTYKFLEYRPEFSSMGIRFDLVVVNFDEYPAKVSHYKGAFWQE